MRQENKLEHKSKKPRCAKFARSLAMLKHKERMVKPDETAHGLWPGSRDEVNILWDCVEDNRPRRDFRSYDAGKQRMRKSVDVAVRKCSGVPVGARNADDECDGWR